MTTTLSQLVAHTESNDDQNAIRFEPACSPRAELIAGMAHVANCSMATAKVLCMMSWGKYQIMGYNLIALGLACNPIAYCANVPMQDDFFGRFTHGYKEVTSLDIVQNATTREAFARFYNGPGNVSEYESRLLAMYARLQAAG